jgi:glycosyltransferase involved in cell wall biosynthesis
MKIAYLIPGTGISGGIAVVCQHVNRLLVRGQDAFMVSQSGQTTIDWFPNQKARVIPIEKYPKDTDILIATGWSTSFAVAKLPARQKFYFVQSDETRFHPKESPFRYLTAFSYLFDFNYFTEARWIQGWLKDNFGHKAEIISNGLDETIWHQTKPIAPKTDRPRVLLEGAIGLPYKGMEDAFNVVKDLDVEVWCVSSFGAPRPEWKCDRFFNECSMSEMHKIYSSCDILLKMSRMEGFFGPPMEMMACGGAVVVGKVTGYDEYIVDGYNALVVEPGDIQAAKSAILRLINDPELKRTLIENGKKTAAEWKWEPSIDKLKNYFTSVLQDKRTISTPVREDINQAVLYFQEMLAIHTDYLVVTHPIESLFLRARNNKAARRAAEVLTFFYGKIKKRVQK